MTYKKPTIKQVAEAARVSTQTVSRVLNERPDVATETRQRVLQVIEALGYYPSALARSMIRQRSLTFGVVTAGLRFIGPSRTLNAIADETDQLGYTLLLKDLPHFHTADLTHILRSLLDRHVEGIIWAVPQVGDNHQWLQVQPTLPVPIIFLTVPGNERFPTVRLDNRQGAYLATRHLIEQGYQTIGHISGPLDWWEAQERKLGWEMALTEAGRPPAPEQWVEGDWSSASGQEACRRLFAQYPALDAVFAANDQMALAVLLEAQRVGRAVPGALGVVGFDNLAEAPYFNPPLTTMVQDHQRLGRAAVELLAGLIQPETPPGAGAPGETGDSAGPPPAPPQVIITPNLIVRESSKRRG